MDEKDIELAKIGLIALIDEATGYQYVRPKDDLENNLKKLRGDRHIPLNKEILNDELK